jgi:tetratricopeptide (TPR) repeat protein
MRSSNSKRLVWILVAGAVSAINGVSLADSFQEVGVSAQHMQTDGKWNEAHELIENNLKTCHSGVFGRSCRLYLNFASGYIAQQEAVTRPNDQQRFLERAAAQYRNVLVEAPAHAATVNNLYLTYRALGEAERARQLLITAAKSDATGTAAVLLANFELEQQRWDEALDAYAIAENLRPDWEVPRLGVVDLYAILPPSRHAELRKRLGDWGDRFPSALEAAYRMMLERSGEDEAAVEDYFPRWITVLSRNDWISTQRVANLNLKSAAKAELLSFLQSPVRTLDSFDWWNASNIRRGALAEVVLAMGK